MISGTMPASWASHVAFPSIQVLSLGFACLQGCVPAVHNTRLEVIAWPGNLCNATLEAFWNSSAQMTAVALANNSLTDSEPDGSGGMSQLVLLGLSGNKLQGTVPLSWLQKGNILSHVSFMWTWVRSGIGPQLQQAGGKSCA